ncbi:MAG TPA: hypothetical protein VEY30_00755 [Myxococcaceae bacterium]|nr:hypothetical protein [Myxococcaceae bacterium]
MTKLAWAWGLLAAAGAEIWTDARVMGLEFKVPSEWRETVRQETHRFEPPSGDAGLEVSVYPVTPRDSTLCVSQLLEALNEKGWESVRMGGEPGAKKRLRDAAPDKKEGYETVTYLGCNGRWKWVMTLSSRLGSGPATQAMAEKLSRSVRYRAAP